MPAGLRAWLRHGVLPGVAVHLLSWVTLLAVNGGFRVMGQEDDGITRLVMERYLWTVVAAVGASLATALTVGAAMGLLVAGIGAGLTGRRPGRGWGRRVAVGVLVYHLGAWALHMRAFPQVHAETFYGRGGVWATLQRAITHGAPGWLFPGLLAVGVAVPALALAAALVRSRAARRRTLWAAAAVGLAWGGWRLARSGPNGGTPQRPNILIIANDSLRPDHLGLSGYARRTSPNLDRFAAQAVVFDEAYVPLARTFPSWASILTGRFPHEHGVRHMFPRHDERLDGTLTLPRYLAQEGYRTAAVADYAGDIFRRIGAGFETVQAPDFDVPSLIRQRVIQIEPALLPYLHNRLGRWLFPDLVGLVNYPHTGETMDRIGDAVDAGDGRPFFIVGFVSSSHFPYAAADPWYRRYVSPDYEGPNLYQRFRGLAETEEALAADAAHLTDLFDGTVAWFDHEVGRLLERLEASGRLDDTVVIVTADHGEILFEFGTTGHGDHLRGRSAHRVPLLVRDPLLTGRRVPGVVRSVDLARTLALRATGQAPEAFGGADLGPLLRGEQTDLGLLGYGETGLWFTPGGPEFYQHHRLPYPSLTGVAELDPHAPDEISMKPAWEDRVRVAKHRAVWDRTHKVTYMPTPTGVVVQGWRVEGGTEVEAPVRPDLKAALDAFLTEGGQARVVRGYALPVAPVAEP
ncbi:MAG: sulfatase [Myxococcales bacterium]|nr:sulfatase [Myxococcales bacterium]